MLTLTTLAVTTYLAKPLPNNAPRSSPAAARTSETVRWEQRNAVLLPGREVASNLQADAALMEELVRIDERARLRALAVRQRLDALPAEYDPHLEMMCRLTSPLDRRHVSEATLSWIADAAEQVASDYLEFMAALVEASEYLEELTEKDLLRAVVPKFGPPEVMRRVNGLLGPAPEAAEARYATLARVHRPTVWSAFLGAAAHALRGRAFRTSGGCTDRGWSACKEWRVLSKLDERAQGLVRRNARAASGGGGHGQGSAQGLSRRQRERRDLEYKLEAARRQRLDGEGGGEDGSGGARWQPTRKQRAMARVASLLATQASEAMAAQLDERTSGRAKVVTARAEHLRRQREVERQIANSRAASAE